MNTMEITKLVGAVCGSLLVFLLLMFFTELIFDTHSEQMAYLIDVPESAAEGDAPEETVDVAALMTAADAAKGETVFKKCATCHKLDGSNAVGPHLDKVVGRAVGGVEGFAYSDPMKTHGGEWTPDKLFAFLGNPKADIPGTKMTFAGLPKPEDRANVIAYLESVSQ